LSEGPIGERYAQRQNCKRMRNRLHRRPPILSHVGDGKSRIIIAGVVAAPSRLSG
jgi:hypothetical protein